MTPRSYLQDSRARDLKVEPGGIGTQHIGHGASSATLLSPSSRRFQSPHVLESRAITGGGEFRGLVLRSAHPAGGTRRDMLIGSYIFNVSAAPKG